MGKQLNSREKMELKISLGIISILVIFKSTDIGEVTHRKNVEGKAQKFRTKHWTSKYLEMRQQRSPNAHKGQAQTLANLKKC